MAGYAVHASDGVIGAVRDLILDDEDWLIRYVLMDTKPHWPGGDVLVDTGSVREVSWIDQAVVVDLTREQVRACPPYDASRPMNREFQRKRYDEHRSGQGRKPET